MPKRLPISRKKLLGLTLDQLTELNELIRQLIQKNKEDGKLLASQRQGLNKGNTEPKRSYRQISIKCGKENCKCATAQGHGPYWYAFWWEDGRTRSTYVGKKRPPEHIRVR